MTRKQLEGICRFVLTFESDMPIEEVNKQFGLELSDADSHVKALTSYLEKNKIQLDDEPKKSESPCSNMTSSQEKDNSERNCKNCSYSEINEVIKSGKYRNFICGCTIFKHYTFLDYWKKTAAIHCDKFKEKGDQIMKAASIKQPWASLIAHGIKDIENRTWATKFRGTIYIHASGKPSFNNLTLNLSHDQIDQIVLGDFCQLDARDEKYPKSAIIGKVDIVDCVINHSSIWAEKTDGVIKYNDGSVFVPIGIKPIYNWVLANPVLFDEPILNVKGKLSLWEFDGKESNS